jgi:3-keto-L-gulonate-6-phosphate decarboxylase
MERSIKKVCEISDPGELRSEILRDKGGKYSCVTCCAVSHNKADLCNPAKTGDAKIFCDIEV